MSQSRKLRVGVAGLGTGKRHVRGFRKHPDVEVVAAADPDPQRRELARRELAVPFLFQTCGDMLEQMRLDVCCIATPNATHRDLVLHAFACGCHVLCEKPLGTSAAQVREMVNAAATARRRLMVNMAYRFLDQVDALRGVIASGRLGRLHRIDSHWLRNTLPGAAWYQNRSISGGGALLDLGIHRLDLALHLLGFPRVCWIEACDNSEGFGPGGSDEAPVETAVQLNAMLETGVTLDVSAAWVTPHLEAERIWLNLDGDGGSQWQANLNGSFEHFAAGYTSGASGTIHLPDEFAHQRTAMQHFASAILEDRPHTCSGDEALRLAELIDAAYAAARQRQRVVMTPSAGSFDS